MGIEFELKYAASQQELQAVKKDISGQWQRISMETTYYDTEAGDFGKRHWTIRRRLENGRSVCTVKTPADNLGRGEWETEADNIEMAIPMLCKLGAPLELEELAKKGLVALCGARFIRYAQLLELEDASVELALDAGTLFAGSRQQPFCEVEVEQKSGSREQVVKYAAALAKTYGLQSETKSKFARARALREG